MSSGGFRGFRCERKQLPKQPPSSTPNVGDSSAYKKFFWCFDVCCRIMKWYIRTPQSVHHAHSNHFEYHHCSPWVGVFLAALLSSINSYTTLDNATLRSDFFVGVAYGGLLKSAMSCKVGNASLIPPSCGTSSAMEISPYRKRSPTERVWQKSDEDSDRSVCQKERQFSGFSEFSEVLIDF